MENSFITSDGWDSETINEETGLIDALAFAYNINYEIANCVRGTHSIDGFTETDKKAKEALRHTLSQLIEELQDAHDAIC